jgi:ribosomal protein S18 acetylase RimI-like enzyme
MSDVLSERDVFTLEDREQGLYDPVHLSNIGNQMSHRDTLQRLTETQLPQAIAMVARAFHNDPVSIYVYPNAAERTRRLPLMFNIALRYTLRYGEITTTPQITGAACWLPPESTTVSIERLLRTDALTTSLKMGLPALRRMNNSENYMRSTQRRCIVEPHWYLWVIGVDPACQGQGVGGMLLRAGLERADASGLPCYLETMNPENVPLYQKFGFTIASEGNIPSSSVRMWGMVRPARVHL